VIYLDASALWAMYYGEPGGDNVIWLLNNYEFYTSEWSVLELSRAVSKRYNQGEITKREADALNIFILADIEKLTRENKLKLIKVTWNLIKKAYHLIFPLNLYASDATHLSTALHYKTKIMFVDDFHFTRLKNKIKKLIILSITENRENIQKILSK